MGYDSGRIAPPVMYHRPRGGRSSGQLNEPRGFYPPLHRDPAYGYCSCDRCMEDYGLGGQSISSGQDWYSRTVAPAEAVQQACYTQTYHEQPFPTRQDAYSFSSSPYRAPPAPPPFAVAQYTPSVNLLSSEYPAAPVRYIAPHRFSGPPSPGVSHPRHPNNIPNQYGYHGQPAQRYTGPLSHPTYNGHHSGHFPVHEPYAPRSVDRGQPMYHQYSQQYPQRPHQHQMHRQPPPAYREPQMYADYQSRGPSQYPTQAQHRIEPRHQPAWQPHRAVAPAQTIRPQSRSWDPSIGHNLQQRQRSMPNVRPCVLGQHQTYHGGHSAPYTSTPSRITRTVPPPQHAMRVPRVANNAIHNAFQRPARNIVQIASPMVRATPSTVNSRQSSVLVGSGWIHPPRIRVSTVPTPAPPAKRYTVVVGEQGDVASKRSRAESWSKASLSPSSSVPPRSVTPALGPPDDLIYSSALTQRGNCAAAPPPVHVATTTTPTIVTRGVDGKSHSSLKYHACTGQTRPVPRPSSQIAVRPSPLVSSQDSIRAQLLAWALKSGIHKHSPWNPSPLGPNASDVAYPALVKLVVGKKPVWGRQLSTKKQTKARPKSMSGFQKLYKFHHQEKTPGVDAVLFLDLE